MIQNYEDVIYGSDMVHLFQIVISQNIHGFSCTSCPFRSAIFFRKSLEWNQSYGSPFTMKNNFLKNHQYDFDVNRGPFLGAKL